MSTEKTDWSLTESACIEGLPEPADSCETCATFETCKAEGIGPIDWPIGCSVMCWTERPNVWTATLDRLTQLSADAIAAMPAEGGARW